MISADLLLSSKSAGIRTALTLLSDVPLQILILKCSEINK